MISEDEAGHQVSYWPSVSDLFMTLFVIAIAMVAVVLFVFVVNPGQDLIEGAVEKLGEAMGLPPSIEATPPGPDRDKVILDIIREATKTIEACKDLRENSNELVRCREQKAQLTRDVARFQERLTKAEEALSRAEQDRERLTADLAVAREQNAMLSDWLLKTLAITAQLRAVLGAISATEPLNDEPPIITIGSDLLFRSGSADIGGASALLQEFQGIAKQIQGRNVNGRTAVDTLEIIGHTDSVPIAGQQKGNLDARMPRYLDGSLALRAMKPGSNNDLGLLRALAIKEAWQQFVADQEPSDRVQLATVSVRTYSAGQTLPKDADIADDPESRRIELRLTKLGS